MDNIKSSSEVIEVLTSMGYEPEAIDIGVRFKIGSSEAAFPVVVYINGGDEMIINCEVATWGEISKNIDVAAKDDFFLGMLDINSQILPYSIAVISDIDGEEDNKDSWPVVLIDSMPLGDLSENEFRASIESLIKALYTAKDLFSVILV